MCIVAVFGVGEDFFQRNAKEPCVDLVNFCHGALRYGDKTMDGNARCSGAALGPDFVTGAGGRMFYTVRDHAVVQLGNFTAACRHTEEWEEGVDEASQRGHEHRGRERHCGAKVFEIGLVHAGGVFGEEFGDHRFAPAFSI